MEKLEKKAEAAANIYIQQAMAKTETQDACWAAKEDYIAGYCLGNVAAQLALMGKHNKAIKLLAELVRIADGRGDYHSSSAARYILEVLK